MANVKISGLPAQTVATDSLLEIELISGESGKTSASSLLALAGGIGLSDIPYPLDFEINSDDPVSGQALFKGHIEVDTTSEVLDDKLTDADYQTSLDSGDTWVTHATIAALDTWIDANITLATTEFLIRAIGTFAVSEIGDSNIKFKYKIQ